MIPTSNDHLSFLLNDKMQYPLVEEILREIESDWAVSHELARFLSRLVVTLKPTSILEFGAGWSSLVFACSLSLSGGGRLTSVDHLVKYCSKAWARLKAFKSIDASLVISRLRPCLTREGLLYIYSDAVATIAARAPYDLVFIDAPPCRYGRDFPLHAAYSYLSPAALVVLDDAARAEESMTVLRWLRRYPGIEPVFKDPKFGRGVAVLRHNGNKSVKSSPYSIVSATSKCVASIVKEALNPRLE